MFDRLWRLGLPEFCPHTYQFGLLSSPSGKNMLAETYSRYALVGNRCKKTTILLTPTWRATISRCEQANIPLRIMQTRIVESVELLQGVFNNANCTGYIGGSIGPIGDCYRPTESPSFQTAMASHQELINSLVDGGVSFLFATTLPALDEAKAIAKLASISNLPYILSFVLTQSGSILDGTPLDVVIKEIDDLTYPRPPLAYGINCCHPRNILAAFNVLASKNSEILSRVHIMQGNTSLLEGSDLESLSKLSEMSPTQFAKDSAAVLKNSRIHVVGGCCGTDERHIEAIAAAAF